MALHATELHLAIFFLVPLGLFSGRFLGDGRWSSVFLVHPQQTDVCVCNCNIYIYIYIYLYRI